MIIVTPKVCQASSATEIDIKKDLKLVNYKVSGIKQVSNGKVLIRCNNVKNAKQLQKAASASLSQKYDVKIFKQFHPKIKIVDIKEDIATEDFVNNFKTQNEYLIHVGSTIKLLHIAKIDIASNVRYTAYVELDARRSQMY